MRQNVVLFSLLAVGTLYIWYGIEENLNSLDEIELENEDNDDILNTTSYHTRKLLFYTGTDSEPNQPDEAWTPHSSTNTRLSGKNVLHNYKNKKSRRHKRRASAPNEQFAWRFNVNVTRHENGTSNKIEYPAEVPDEASKDKYLGMSMSVAGNGPDQSVEELYQAWESVGQLLRSLFGGNLEELKSNGHGVSVEASPNGTKDLELFVEGSGEEETRDRKGKFLLGLFGFGANQENPPRDEGSGEPLDVQESNGTEAFLVIKSGNVTIESTDASNDGIEVNSVATNIISIATETEDVKEALTPNSMVDHTSTSEITFLVTPNSTVFEEAVLDLLNCTDCEIKTEITEPNEEEMSNEDSSTLFVPVSNTESLQSPFSSEALKDFCSAMLLRMRKSPRSMERSAGNEGSGSFDIDDNNSSELTVGTHASSILTDEPKLQNLGFLERIWNRILGRKIPPVHEIVKDSRGARLINLSSLLGGFGSGRSAGEASNIEFDNFDVEEIGSEDSEQFLSDCEAFLLSVQTENRPNIFDLVNPHTDSDITTESTTPLSELVREKNTTVVELALDFESTSQGNGLTAMPMIRETNKPNVAKDELSTNSLSKIQITTEVQDKIPFEEIQTDKPIEISTQIEELTSTNAKDKIKNDSLHARNLVVETTERNLEFQTTETLNLSVFSSSFGSESTTKVSVGSDLDDKRSLTFFGFGSGVGESSDEGSGDIKERIFGLVNFGSGEREMKESEVSTEDSPKERRFFSIFGFGSGGRELVTLNSSELDTTENLFASTTESKGRVFEFIGFGSGERELPDTMEVTTVNSETQTESPSITKESVSGTLNPLNKDFSSEVDSEQVNIHSMTTTAFDDTDEGSETSTETNEPQGKSIFGFNMFGSGDGREISEVETDTENVNCMDCYSGNDTDIECNNCEEYSNDSDIFISSDKSTPQIIEETSDDQICIDCKVINPEYTSASLDETISSTFSPLKVNKNSNENYKEEKGNSTTDMVQYPVNQEKDGSIETPQVTTTVQIDPRLIGTIFLTGSGEGGLFVDNKGPINLVQESEFTSPVFEQFPKKGRGARFHDPDFEMRGINQFERLPEVTEPAPDASKSTRNLVTTQKPLEISTMGTNTNQLSDETTMVLETTENVTKAETTPEFETDEENITSTSSTTSKDETDVTSTTTAYSTTENATELVSSTVGVVITSMKITPRTKITEPSVKFCSSASECDRSLNERCITKGKTAICNCGRSYVRNRETGKCESPVVLKTSLKLPGEVYHEDLKNRNSLRFQKKRNDSIETMFILLGDDPALFRAIAGVDVSGFESGSLVVHWQISLAPPNHTDGSIPSLIDQVDAELKEAFEDETLLKRAPLNVHNAVLMAVTSDMDLCAKTELNYCSPNANCLPDVKRGFVCRCKDDYMDKSTDSDHPGEVCIASCPPYYCGEHGECNLKRDGNRHCSCNSWYFGEQCEISGIVVIAGFASLNVLLIITVIILVCVCKKRRYRQSRFYGQNQVRFQPDAEMGRFTASPRLADTIAMSDVGPTKVRKYMAISTPLHSAPTIQIRSPSIMGSSVDYDYDSTFDRTPSAGETTNEVQKTGDTLQV